MNDNEEEDLVPVMPKAKRPRFFHEETAVTRKDSFIQQISRVQQNSSIIALATFRRPIAFRCEYIPTRYNASFAIDGFQRLKTWRKSMDGNFENKRTFTTPIHALLTDVVDAIPFFQYTQNGVVIIPKKSAEADIPGALALRRRDNVPFFVVEVNKSDIFGPVFPIDKIKLIYDQMFDNLSNIRDAYGIENPFGILATLSEFQICWLHENTNRHVLRVSDIVWKIDRDQITSSEAVRAIASALSDAFNSARAPVLYM